MTYMITSIAGTRLYFLKPSWKNHQHLHF